MRGRLFFGSLCCQQHWTPARSCCLPQDGMDETFVRLLYFTNKKVFQNDQIYELRRKSRKIPYFFGKIPEWKMQTNPVPKIWGSLDFAKYRPGNSGLKIIDPAGAWSPLSTSQWLRWSPSSWSPESRSTCSKGLPEGPKSWYEGSPTRNLAPEGPKISSAVNLFQQFVNMCSRIIF